MSEMRDLSAMTDAQLAAYETELRDQARKMQNLQLALKVAL